MEKIQVLDKQFRLYLPESEIQEVVRRVAAELSRDYKGRNPILCPVLTGSFVFAADLVRQLDFDAEVSFVRYSSYSGMSTTGKVKEVMGLNEDISGRTVIIVEDIVDTGRTMRQMLDSLGVRRPASIHICTLFVKPDKLEEPLDIEYAAFSIPNDFIVGYGLDYDQQGRGLKEIYTLVR